MQVHNSVGDILRDTKQAIKSRPHKRRKAIALASENQIAKKAACHIEAGERGLGFTIPDEHEGAALRVISGICGFVGSALARELRECGGGIRVSRFDNFIHPGSQINRTELRRLSIAVVHADVRSTADVETLPAADASKAYRKTVIDGLRSLIFAALQPHCRTAA